MKPLKKITVLLAEDHAVVREGLCALLNVDGRFSIVGEAQTGREAVELARTLRPDIILMDIAMPVLNGLDATRQILAANLESKVLILSARSDDEYIKRATDIGAVGFLEKQSGGDVLAMAISEVAKGNLFFSPGIAKRLAGRRPRSTSRAGVAGRKASAVLRARTKTVEKLRRRMISGLSIQDAARLARHAFSQGIVESGVVLKIV
jgi:DNA-binding NarL/FixJ family response regulator